MPEPPNPKLSPGHAPDPRHSDAERRALDELFSLIYEELRRLASMVRRNEAHGTLNSTGLVHEAWMRLRESPSIAANSPAHFKAIAARAMRQILVDEARRRSARKRGDAGEVVFVSSEQAIREAAWEMAASDEELALDNSLRELAARSERQVQMVECRFFGGMTVTETAAVLGVSEAAIERDWRAAKAWLASRIRPLAGPVSAVNTARE